MADEQQVNGAAQNEAQQEQQQAFQIQRVYTKDVSFEAPNAPQVFRQEWNPELNIDLNVRNEKIEDGVYEVVLKITATNKLGDTVAFIAEVHQAGIFTVTENIPEQQRAHLLGAYCPTILFPYARECLASLVGRATFPQLNIAPINFDAIFAQHVAEQQQRQQQPAAQADA